jgi:carnitine monooxygenase subunit
LFAIQVYPGGIVNTYRWRPEAVDRTTIEVDWWLPNKVPNAVESAIIDQHRTTTFAEDAPIVDAVQRGLASGGFDRGPLVVENACGSQSEHPILAFQRQYRSAMGVSETAGVSAA